MEEYLGEREQKQHVTILCLLLAKQDGLLNKMVCAYMQLHNTAAAAS